MKTGWQTKKLGDVATLQRGFDLPRQDRSSGDVPLVTSSGISDTVSKSAVDGPGVATGRSGSIGNVFFIEEDFWPLNTVLYVKDFHGNDPRFVFHLLKDFDLKRFATGTGVPTLNRNCVHDELVNVPPLAEQQRIVGLLDEAFEGLATAKANAEKNLQNARALFESHLQSIFTQRGPGWVAKRLEDIADADCSLSYGIVQPGEEFDEGMPIVRPTDLTSKVIRLTGLKRIDPKLAEGYKRTTLQGGELLLCVRGSTGVISIASTELVGANVTRGIVPIRFNRSLLLSEFGFHLLSGGPVQRQIREKTYGTALMQINIRDLRLISLSIPPLNEQRAIAAKLDSLYEETQRLARLYERKLAVLEALKRSLLHQAFSGEL